MRQPRGQILCAIGSYYKLAEYLNATPTQLFGTSKEIELKKSILESKEYSDKVNEILKVVKYIEHFLHTDKQHLEDLLYLTRGKHNYTQKMDKNCILIQLLMKEYFTPDMNLDLLC